MLTRDFALPRLDRVHGAGSPRELFEVFDAIAPDFGVVGFALVKSPDTEHEHPSFRDFQEIVGGRLHLHTLMHTASCPPSYAAIFTEAGPAWRRANDATDPKSPPNGTPTDAVGARLEPGHVIPTHTPSGNDGTVSFLMSRQDRDGGDLLWLVMLALALHSRLEWLETHPVGSGLSRREHEILAWLAQGKSAEDVAAILEISPATVMFHYRNVAHKYGTLNRTHTVVEAFRRGELVLVTLAPAIETARFLLETYTI